MSRIYDALKRLEAAREAPKPTAAPIDAIRLEQFLDLQRDLVGSGETDLPDRLVHRVATFLGVDGAALGALEQGAYRLVATYGLGYDDRSIAEAAPLTQAELALVVTEGRPLVRERRIGATPVEEVVLPFRGAVPGALHLTIPEETPLTDDKLQLARLLAGMLGAALGRAPAGTPRGR
jgi:hypothetical protein